MINTKKYINLLFLFLFLFILYHLIIWHLFTKNIFDRTDQLYIGDLGRLSYQIDSLFPRKLEYSLENRFLTTTNNTIDILTVGDSFSNAAMGGLNPYYQDYLATKYNKNILNLKRANENHNPFEDILHLYNTGWLQEHKPKVIIIEFVERYAISEFAKDFNFNFVSQYIKNDNLIQIKKTVDSYIPQLKIINTANYKFLFHTIKYHFTSKGKKDIYKLQLEQNLFSTPRYQNTLLIMDQDINSIKEINQKSIKKLNQNFNKLSKLLQPLNIKLFFMPAVDKYDLYYSYIKNNPYPKNHFFDILRPLQKNYYFVDTKKILKEELKKGTLDLYYSDDTHWSYKTSKIITNDKIFTENLLD